MCYVTAVHEVGEPMQLSEQANPHVPHQLPKQMTKPKTLKPWYSKNKIKSMVMYVNSRLNIKRQLSLQLFITRI